MTLLVESKTARKSGTAVAVSVRLRRPDLVTLLEARHAGEESFSLDEQLRRVRFAALFVDNYERGELPDTTRQRAQRTAVHREEQL